MDSSLQSFARPGNPQQQHPPLYGTQTATAAPALGGPIGANGVGSGHEHAGGSQYHQAAVAAATANAALSQGHQQQQHSELSTPSPSAQNKKRRATGAPGSRGVANLTAEQLAKKRANDREAQRAIRERTKSNIETLERRIKELESQQPFQELQRVTQERDRALAECEELRQRLHTVAGIVGGGNQPPGLSELANLTAQQTPLPPTTYAASHLPLQTTPSYPQGNLSQTGPDQQHLHPDLRSPRQVGHPTPQSLSGSAGTSPAYQDVDTKPQKSWTPYNDVSASHPSQQQQGQEQYDQSHNSYLANGDPVNPDTAARGGARSLLDQSQQQQSQNPSFLTNPPHTTGTPVYSSQMVTTRYAPSPAPPAYSRLPIRGNATCVMDELLNSFSIGRRKLLDAGQSSAVAVGPDTPVYYKLMFPTATVVPPTHHVSGILVDIILRFPSISALPTKVAVYYIMFHYLRWSICPCAPCFEKLPEWMRPVKEQLELPHPTWADYLPWPHMRRQMALNPKLLTFDDFFVTYTVTLSLNWPYDSNSVLFKAPPPADRPDDPPHVGINPIFEHHVRNLDNWTLGSAFKNAHPYLVDDSVRIVDKPS